MQAVTNQAIERSILNHVRDVLTNHGINECIIIFPLLKKDGTADFSISQMHNPGSKPLFQMEIIKSTCDQVLTQLKNAETK